MKRFLLSCLFVFDLSLCSGNKHEKYYKTPQDPYLLQQTVIDFEIQAEGFNEDIFDENNIGRIVNKIERDIQRKTNKLSEVKGLFNYTKVQTEEGHYMAIDGVTCSASNETCTAKDTSDNCQSLKCVSTVSHDLLSDSSTVEYNFMKVTEMYFKFAPADDNFNNQEYTGPFAANATSTIQIVGVPPFLMNENETEVFLNTVSEFLETLDGSLTSDMDVRSVNLSKQDILEKRLNNHNVLEVVVHHVSLHDTAFAEPDLKLTINDLIDKNGEHLVQLLHSTDSNYFKNANEAGSSISFSEAEGLNDINNMLRVRIFEPNEQKKDSGSKEMDLGISLVYGMFFILVVSLVPTVTYIVLHRKRRRASAYVDFHSSSSENDVL